MLISKVFNGTITLVSFLLKRLDCHSKVYKYCCKTYGLRKKRCKVVIKLIKDQKFVCKNLLKKYEFRSSCTICKNSLVIVVKIVTIFIVFTMKNKEKGSQYIT